MPRPGRAPSSLLAVTAMSAGTSAMMDKERVQESMTCRRTAQEVSAAAKYRSNSTVAAVTMHSAGTAKDSCPMVTVQSARREENFQPRTRAPPRAAREHRRRRRRRCAPPAVQRARERKRPGGPRAPANTSTTRETVDKGRCCQRRRGPDPCLRANIGNPRKSVPSRPEPGSSSRPRRRRRHSTMAHACVASQALVASVAARVRGSAKLGDATRRRFAPRASASFSRARRAVLARASDEASATADEGPARRVAVRRRALVRPGRGPHLQRGPPQDCPLPDSRR